MYNNNNIFMKDQFYNGRYKYLIASPTPLRKINRYIRIEFGSPNLVFIQYFSIFVNYLPIADITYLVPSLFKSISKEALKKIDNILYSP